MGSDEGVLEVSDLDLVFSLVLEGGVSIVNDGRFSDLYKIYVDEIIERVEANAKNKFEVDNDEEKYYYEWTADKFHNRIYMIREILE